MFRQEKPQTWLSSVLRLRQTCSRHVVAGRALAVTCPFSPKIKPDASDINIFFLSVYLPSSFFPCIKLFEDMLLLPPVNKIKYVPI